jgi:dTDP-glucose 4,6-dehydratase
LDILLAGGAGFIGSHLVRHFMREGHHVVAVDNASSGRWTNLAGLEDTRGPGRLTRVAADICEPLPPGIPFDAVLNFASPASPVDYLRRPIETLEAGAAGTRRLLEVARLR